MTKITAAGCSVTAMAAAFIACTPGDPLVATASALSIFGYVQPGTEHSCTGQPPPCCTALPSVTRKMFQTQHQNSLFPVAGANAEPCLVQVGCPVFCAAKGACQLAHGSAGCPVLDGQGTCACTSQAYPQVTVRWMRDYAKGQTFKADQQIASKAQNQGAGEAMTPGFKHIGATEAPGNVNDRSMLHGAMQNRCAITAELYQFWT